MNNLKRECHMHGEWGLNNKGEMECTVKKWGMKFGCEIRDEDTNVIRQYCNVYNDVVFPRRSFLRRNFLRRNFMYSKKRQYYKELKNLCKTYGEWSCNDDGKPVCNVSSGRQMFNCELLHPYTNTRRQICPLHERPACGIIVKNRREKSRYAKFRF